MLVSAQVNDCASSVQPESQGLGSVSGAHSSDILGPSREPLKKPSHGSAHPEAIACFILPKQPTKWESYSSDTIQGSAMARGEDSRTMPGVRNNVNPEGTAAENTTNAAQKELCESEPLIPRYSQSRPKMPPTGKWRTSPDPLQQM